MVDSCQLINLSINKCHKLMFFLYQLTEATFYLRCLSITKHNCGSFLPRPRLKSFNYPQQKGKMH